MKIARAIIFMLSVFAGVASASQINVAILSAIGNATFESDVVTAIQADAPFLNITVLPVDTSTPDSATLALYRAVMVVGNNPFSNATTLGNNLVTYMSGGGGVVYTATSNGSALNYHIAGGFDNLTYWLIGTGPQMAAVNLTMTIKQPASPILAGVGSLNSGTNSPYISAGISSGATEVADWSNGVPLIATKTQASGAREVALNFYPVSNLDYSTLWDQTTDGNQILANALVWAADVPADPVAEPRDLLLSGAGLILLTLIWQRRCRRRPARETLQFKSDPGPRHC